jgi:hypothetical protein
LPNPDKLWFLAFRVHIDDRAYRAPCFYYERGPRESHVTVAQLYQKDPLQTTVRSLTQSAAFFITPCLGVNA